MFQSGALLWDNTNISVGTTGIVSTELGGRPPDSTVVNAADDFEVPSGVKWSIDSIYAEGLLQAGTTINPDAFAVAMYEDTGGMPGSLIFREDIIPAGGIEPNNPHTSKVGISGRNAGNY